MSKEEKFTTAVVLSLGVWDQVIQLDTSDGPDVYLEQRLSALLRKVLALHQFRGEDHPSDCKFDHPMMFTRTNRQFSVPLQMDHLTPLNQPPFLRVRLPNETFESA